MGKNTKKQVLPFIAGLVLVSFVTIIGTLAFSGIEVQALSLARNVVITDVVFGALFIVWVRLHKGYETIYKSGLNLEEEK